MRKEFIKILCERAKVNKNIFLIVADLGFGVIEPFVKNFPKNFINVGISEQNMAGMAAGIASEGFKVFIYSIANFSTFRCAEQIRNDIDYHKLDVTIVSVGAGVGYGSQGYTHHALQDYSLMRSFPNMEIISPSNNQELLGGMKYIFNNSGPKYLRLDKDEISIKVKKEKLLLKPGQWVLIKKGTIKKTILITGSCLDKALALEKVKYKNYYIFSLPIWASKYKKMQNYQLKKFSEVVVLENHFQDGGFSSWLREAKKDNLNIKIKSISILPEVTGVVGSRDFLEKKFFK
jgi:transketolase